MPPGPSHVFSASNTICCSLVSWHSDVEQLRSEQESTSEFSGPWYIFISLRAFKGTAEWVIHVCRISGVFPASSASGMFVCLHRVAFASSLQVERWSDRPRANLVFGEWCSIFDGNLNSFRSPPGTGPGRRNPSPSMRSCSRFWRYESKNITSYSKYIRHTLQALHGW